MTQADPFSYHRELSAEQNNVAILQLQNPISPGSITEIDRRRFEGRGGRYLSFLPTGSLYRVTLEIALDNPDGKYFPLAPGSYVSVEPYKWSRMYVRIIPLQPNGSIVGSAYLGFLILADHFVVDPKGSSPDSAYYVKQPYFFANSGNSGFVTNTTFFPSTSHTALPPFTDYACSLNFSPTLDSRNLSLEIEVTNTGPNTIYCYLAVEPNGVPNGTQPSTSTQLYALGSNEKTTFFLGYDIASSAAIEQGYNLGINILYFYSDTPGSSIQYKLKAYR